MSDYEVFLWAAVCVVLYIFMRNRIRHALYQKQKEDFWREVARRVEQKKKIDALYGRGRDESR